MYRLLIGLLLVGCVETAITNARTLGVTHTQAILSYTAPSTSVCIVEVSTQAAYTPLANDVDF